MFASLRSAAVVVLLLSTSLGCAAPAAAVRANQANHANQVIAPSRAPAAREIRMPPPATSMFLTERAEHPTRLERHGPAPQEYEPWRDAPGLKVVEYVSGGRTLKGVLAHPRRELLLRNERSPVLVYLHGGFALGPGEVADCRAFLNAGFLVWAPALRGENGNPGDFEFAFGELDDVRAALDAVRTLPGADPSRVVVLGHSLGGLLSTLLTLYPSLPVLDTGSAAGLYESSIFDAFPRPFADAPIERRLRLFTPHRTEMKQPHFACVGDQDVHPLQVLRRILPDMTAAHLPFAAKVVPGDHWTSLQGCMNAYLERVLPKVRYPDGGAGSPGSN